MPKLRKSRLNDGSDTVTQTIREIVLHLKEMELPEPPILGVYFLLFNREVVYVGFSTDIKSRITQHQRDYERYAPQKISSPRGTYADVIPKQFNEVRYIETSDEEGGLELEEKLIIAIRPRYNKLGNINRRRRTS